MSMLTIQELLALRGLDVNCPIKLVRHQTNEWPLEDMHRDGTIEIYQSYQSKRPFDNCEYIVSFIGQENSRARFLGVYRVGGTCRADESPFWNHPQFAGRLSPEWNYYELVKETGFEDLEERVIINWGGAAQAWKQWLHLQPKEVIEILPRGYVKDFPDYPDVILRYDELKRIVDDPEANREWHRMLGAVAGVYLITDLFTGNLYVGSASGEEGILGRWKTYARSGHGGNILLKGLLMGNPQYATSYFQYSILHVLPRTMTWNDVRKNETLFKNKLGSRAFGLNAN